MSNADLLARIGQQTEETEFYTPMPAGYRKGHHKYVIVVGTVISGLGKGIFSSSMAKLLKDKGRVVVEGVNTVKRHLKATPQRGGGILQVEAPLPVSHVMPVDPESGKPTRVRAKVDGDTKQRIAKTTGDTIDG